MRSKVMKPGFQAEQGSSLGSAVRSNIVPLVLALVYTVVQYTFNAFHGFGYFTDELYYLACAARPAAGYVDQPPLSILILSGVVSLLGDSIAVLRILPAIAGGGTVLLTGIMARKLGGNAFASGLACLGVMAAPVLMVLFGFYSMNSFEVLLWTAFTLTAVTALVENRPRLWLLAGLIAGLGLENKHTMGVYGLAFCAGLLLTSGRRHLKSPWLWAGGAAALLLILPNLVWQMQNGWQSVEFYRNADAQKNLHSPFWKVFLDQVLAQNPVSVVLWIPGLLYLMFGKPLEPVRGFAWMYLILLFTLMIANSSRPDRIAAAYPVLFAAGACFLAAPQRKFAAYASAVLLAVGAAVFAPAGLPVLPPDQLASYARTIGVIPQIEKGNATALPMWFGNRFDWENVYSSVKRVYESLPAADKRSAVVYTAYYAQAGAVELYARGSIPVISGHNNYYLWRNEEQAWKTVIAVGVPKERLHLVFEEVEQVASYSRRYSNQTDVPIYLCRRPRFTPVEMWKKRSSMFELEPLRKSGCPQRHGCRSVLDNDNSQRTKAAH